MSGGVLAAWLKVEKFEGWIENENANEKPSMLLLSPSLLSHSAIIDAWGLNSYNLAKSVVSMKSQGPVILRSLPYSSQASCGKKFHCLSGSVALISENNIEAVHW